MAINLFAKKLSKRPIGTHVELTIAKDSDSLEVVAGVITDSDFTSSVEITAPDGTELILDYALIKGFQATKSLEEVLQGLTEGTRVRFSYGDEDNRDPDQTGTVGENDGEESIEIICGKKELVLNYDIIRSLIVLKAPPKEPEDDGKENKGPVPPPPPPPPPKPVLLYQKQPDDPTNVSDGKIKETFDLLPRLDVDKLKDINERFKYGIKISDDAKLAAAANQARQTLFYYDDRKYTWSVDAALYCGYLLRRSNIFDSEVFIIGECFEEAAYAAWREKKYDRAGAYAITALLESCASEQNMMIILAHSVVKGNDVSGLRFMADRVRPEQAPVLDALIADAFAAKGLQRAAGQETAAALDTLAQLYPNTEMGKEAEYWLPPEPAEKPAPDPIPAPAPGPVPCCGAITRINWMDHTGVITTEDGAVYTFRYQDIADADLSKTISDCLRADLGGKTHLVKFLADQSKALQIRPDFNLVERARSLTANAGGDDRFERAFELCKMAMETPDKRRALGDMFKYAISIHASKQQLTHIRDAVSIFEKHTAYFPNNAFALIELAMCYGLLKKYSPMIEYAEKAMAVPGLMVRQRIAVLSSYLKMFREYYDISGDRSLLERMLEKIDALRQSYSKDFDSDKQIMAQYISVMMPYRVIAECGLDRLEDAEADYTLVPANNMYLEFLTGLMDKTRSRLAPKEAPVEIPDEPAAEPAPEEPADEQPVPAAPIIPAEAAAVPAAPEQSQPVYVSSYDDEYEDEPDENVHYEDHDGWKALKLTPAEVIGYAMKLASSGQIPAMLAYLRAGSQLNSRITPVYRAAALATNDPMEAPDYNLTALVTAPETFDADYHDFNDCCMGAAFLRTSFLSGRGYDYGAQGLRNTISVTRLIPALDEAYDTLEVFRKEVGREIDIYADYRNQGVKKLSEQLSRTVRDAGELYLKFIQTPAREGVKFARLLDTKKIVFARNGYLATMLSHIINNDHKALEAEKEHFVSVYLGGIPQFSNRPINPDAIDDIITDGWDRAGQGMQMKKLNETLQGNRRNNLRSNVSEILGTIRQWYALSEQNAGLTWRTDAGVRSYQRLLPQLMDQLGRICEECHAEAESCPDEQLRAGLYLLASAARELSQRLDGSWKFGQEKYMYTDFLRGNEITLGEDFMPELDATFCVLPEFNVLARIRRHVETEQPSFQEQIQRIYSMDKTCNNYGTARQILAYLEALGQQDSVTLPENAERFVTHTEMQIDRRYRGFRESYALSMNYGQIIKSDDFCYTLEAAIRYWYLRCKQSQNFGFFVSILLQADHQIHTSAAAYEETLSKQLSALIDSNKAYFDAHPEYSQAISDQISKQSFTVAEDWMARIRMDDFSLDVPEPEAIRYLERFWSTYDATYSRVAEARLSLLSLLGRRNIHNKDTKRAQQLIDNWLHNGRPTNCERIGQLLNLLGWQNIRVSPYQFAEEPRGEFYAVSKEKSSSGLTTPLHPIAAFGSNLEKKRMYVVCLYGIYDCDRLYEKLRALDVIDGSKIILLDFALGQPDRRGLARKLKKRESSLRNVNIVIDRVLITHLADHYNENLINRILMATAMPFTYCQPYVVESIHTMPPEIFIGRRDELLRIEEPDGVNLIYGGRQLGKSALFKKALADLDGHQKQRAALIDINKLGCAAAAMKVSAKLIDLNITPGAEVTDDWTVLCRNIERRLRSQDDEICYFLLMLDEADSFITDCASCGYAPLVALKDIQQSMPGQFKYVLAGLHNIVRFNREVALGNNSVITHMPSLKITPFRTPEAQELLTGPLSYLGFSLPSKVTISQILATCNYFPGLIQLYAKKLLESVRAADYAGYDMNKTPPYVVSDAHLRRVMADKEFMEQIHDKFQITLTLDQDQGSCYYPLALLIGWMYSEVPSESGYTARQVLRHAQDLSVHPLSELPEEKIDALLMELQDLNILRSVSNNSYLLASKNFRDLLGSDEEIFDKLTTFGRPAV